MLLVFFLRPVLCFRGTRRSSMFSCVFGGSRKVCALLFGAGSLLCTFQASVSVFFCVLYQFVGRREAWPAPFLHRGSARAHICANWRRQATNSEENGVTKSISPLPRGSFFGHFFVTFRYFSELNDFVKIQLPWKRGLDFESPGPSKCHFFSLGTPSKNLRGPGGSCQGGGPRGKT